MTAEITTVYYMPSTSPSTYTYYLVQSSKQSCKVCTPVYPPLLTAVETDTGMLSHVPNRAGKERHQAPDSIPNLDQTMRTTHAFTHTRKEFSWYPLGRKQRKR